MTREEEIYKIAKEYSENEYNEIDASNAFIAGAKYADKNPQSPWISVKEDLPCNHEELISYVCKSKYGVIKQTKDVVVCYTDKCLGIRHMVSFDDDEWRWYPQNSDILYWMPIPELPKE